MPTMPWHFRLIHLGPEGAVGNWIPICLGIKVYGIIQQDVKGYNMDATTQHDATVYDKVGFYDIT